MKTPLIALCSVALLSGAAFAADTDSNDRRDTFAALDRDSDGKLSKEEVASSPTLANSFSMLDGDSDGYVDRGEFRRKTVPKPKRD